MPNAAYEVLFTTNASKVEGEIKSLHQQVGKAIVPTVDLSNLKALNAELDLKQRHLRQTIAYFRQNQIKASMDLSMPAITPAALQKALPSAEVKKVAQQQAKQLHSALQSATEQAGPIEVEFKVLDPAGITAAKAQLANLIRGAKTFPRQGQELGQLTALAQRKGIGLPGLENIAKPTVAATREALIKGLEQAGDQAIAGFVKSLNAGNSTAKDAAQRLGLAALKQIKNTLGIASPSKEFIKIGVFAIQGLIEGIKQKGPEAIKDIRALGKLMDDAMRDAIVKQQKLNAIKPLANNGAEAGKDFSERLADGITSGASKAVAAAKKVAAQVSAAMRGGGGGGGGAGGAGGGTGLGSLAPSGPSPSNLRALSGQTLGSFKRRQHVGGNQFVIEDVIGLYEQLAAVERKINRVPINSNAFRRLSSNAGFRQGEIERAQNISQVQRLRASGQFFEEGSLTRLSKQLQALQIEASQVKPDTQEWNKYQAQIAQLQRHLEKSAQSARLITLNELAKSVPVNSLTALSAKLEKARLQSNDLAGDTDQWRLYQKEIAKTTIEMEKLARTSKKIELKVRESTAEEGSIASLRAQLERRQMNLEFLAPDSAKFAKTTKEMQRLERQIDRISRKPTPMGDRLGAAAGAVLYGGGLAGSPLSALGGIAGGLTGGIAGSFTGAAIGQTADQLIAAASASATYAANLSRLRIALAGVSGDFENYLANLKAVNDISNTYATSIDKVIVPYTKLQASVLAAGYSAQTTKEIFEGVTAASIATGGSADDLEGSMRAVTQIFAKGTVQSEELVGQLSERIPGAFALFAKFNNMSTSSLKDALQAGQVGLDNFIAFNKGLLQTYGQSAKEIAKGPEYAGQRLEAALKRLQGSVGGSLAPIGAAFQDWATGVANNFDKVIKKMQQYGLLSNQLSSGGIVEEVLSGKRSREKVTEDIASLRKEIAARKKEVQSSQFAWFANTFDESMLANMLFPPRLSKNTEGLKSKEQRLAVLSAAEASLKRRDEIIKNGLKQQAQAQEEQRKDQFAKLRDSYDSILKKQRDLTREIDDETFRRRVDNAKKEVEIYRARQQLDIDAADYRYQKLIDGEDGAKAEMMSALADYIRTRDEANANNQAKQRSFQVSLIEMQKEMERVRLDTWEKIQEIAKAIGKYQIDVMNAQIKAMRGNLSDVTGATAPYGPTQTQGMVARTGNTGDSTGAHLDIRWGDGRPITAAQADRYFRVKGEPPSKYGVTSQYGPRNLFGRSFHGGIDFGTPAGSPITLTGGAQFSKNLGNTGAGGYAIEVMTPEGTMKALHLMANSAIQSVPVRPQGAATAALQAPAGSMAMQVDGVPQAGLAQAPQMLPTTFSVDTRELERQINRSRDLETLMNELSRLGDSQKTQQAFDAITKRTFPRLKLNDLRTEVATQQQVLQLTQDTGDEELSAIRAQAKARDENTRKQLSDIKKGAGLELFYQKLSSTERDKLAKAAEEAAKLALQDSAEQARLQEKLVMIERDKSSLKDKTSLQDQLGLFALSAGVERETKRLQIERNISEEMARSLATLQSQITFSQELEQIRAQQKLAVTAPGMETMVQEYVNQGYSMEQARMAAMEKAQAERLTSMKQAFVSLGESINTTLGSTIVNVATDWGNFTKNVQDSVKTLQDAFKQLANAIINEMTRALASKAVGWLMNVSGIAPMTGAQGGEGVKKFANGGIVTGPTLGLIGEGRYNEAIIPMPNNRAVPVDLKGAVGGSYSTSIAVNISNSSAGATAESQITGDQGNKLAGVLDKAVKQAILNEQRPGGALYRQ